MISRKLGIRTLVMAAVALATAVALGRGAMAGDDQGDDRIGRADEGQRYTIALWGDMPYGALGKTQYPALLADVNAHHVVRMQTAGTVWTAATRTSTSRR